MDIHGVIQLCPIIHTCTVQYIYMGKINICTNYIGFFKE